MCASSSRPGGAQWARRPEPPDLGNTEVVAVVPGGSRLPINPRVRALHIVGYVVMRRSGGLELSEGRTGLLRGRFRPRGFLRPLL